MSAFERIADTPRGRMSALTDNGLSEVRIRPDLYGSKWPRADIEDPASRAGSLTGARLQSGQDRLTANATEYELVHFDFGCV